MLNIDLLITNRGNGATCCDRRKEINGDYLKVAHINEKGITTFYQPLNEFDQSRINAFAWSHYGEKQQIIKFIEKIYPRHSYTMSQNDFADENLLKTIIRTHNSKNYEISIYKHSYSPQFYNRNLFFTYIII